MAKIRKEEIIDTGILTEHIKQLEQVLALNKELDNQYKKTAATRKSAIGGTDVNSIQGIKAVNAEVQKSIKLKELSISTDKQKLKLDQQLKTATDAEVKGKLRLQEATRKQKELLKEEIALENKQIGTLAKLAIANKKLNREKKTLDLTTKQGTERLKQINAEMNRNTAIVNKNATAQGKLKANIGNYPKALGRATAGMKQFAGALGLTSGIFLLVQGLKDAVKLVADFEQGNANLASILGKTKKGITTLTEDAKRLGSVTAFTASQVTKLQTEFAKLGFNEKEIINATEATLNLAAATGAELGEAAAIAGATLGGFGLDASETQRVTDVMAKSFSSSALDMNKFAESMKEAAPASKAVGISIEKTTALLGTLASAGISGSKAGGSLKTGFIQLNAAGIDLDTALEKISNSEDKLSTATELVGKRAATSFLVLADGVKVTNELEEGLINSGGAAKEMADTQLDTLSGSVTLAKSAYEGFILSLEDGEGGIAKWARSTVDATAVFFNLISGIKQTDEALESLRFGSTIVKVKNFIDTWSVALESVENFTEAMKDTVDILTFIVTFGLVEEMSEDVFGLTTATEKYDAAQRKAINTTAIAQFGIKKLSASVTEYTVKEQRRITALAEGNLTQDQRNVLINDLTNKYPELIKNYDLENLSQEDAIKLNKELQVEIINTAILKEKALAITFLNVQVEKELAKIQLISNANVRKQKLEELEFTKNAQLARIDAIEKETRIRLGLAEEETEELEDLSDEVLENAEGNDKKRSKSAKSTSKEIIDHAEIEEKRLFDLRQKRIADQKENEKENEKIREENAKKEADRVAKQNADQEKAEEQKRERERLAEEKRIKTIKDNIQLTADLLNAAADARLSKLDNEIESSQDRISESQSTVDDLKAQANLGNLDAQASIKAEKEAIANEKLNIDALEKKKTNLQILVTGLALANEKIQSGDGNALANAGADMGNFINTLKGFYDGTETTLGADLGNAYAISGDRDTHIIKAHKDEHIIGVKNSRKLGNMNQDDIVKGALMLKNGEFVGNRVVGNMVTSQAFNDVRMITAMNKVEKAINNIKIPEHNFNYDAIKKMAIEQMKVGNVTTNNHTKIGGRLW